MKLRYILSKSFLDLGVETLRRATPGSAAFDLHADISSPLRVPSEKTVIVPTGLWLDLSECPNTAALVLIRSGCAKEPAELYLANQVGLIDNDFPGEIKLLLRSRNPEGTYITPMARIAQCMLVPYYTPECVRVENFDYRLTMRTPEGFGSTGTH